MGVDRFLGVVARLVLSDVRVRCGAVRYVAWAFGGPTDCRGGCPRCYFNEVMRRKLQGGRALELWESAGWTRRAQLGADCGERLRSKRDDNWRGVVS